MQTSGKDGGTGYFNIPAGGKFMKIHPMKKRKLLNILGNFTGFSLN